MYKMKLSVLSSTGAITNYIEAVNNPIEAGLFLQEIKNLAAPGDLIIVGPGRYDTKDILKNQVNYYFKKGAILEYTGGAIGSLLNDDAGALNCEIFGFGKFINSSNVGSNDVISLVNGSNFYIEANTIKSVNNRGSILHNVDARLNIKCHFISASDGVIDQTNGKTNIKAIEILGIDSFAIENDGGQIFVHSNIIRTLAGASSAIYASGGSNYVKANLIESLNPAEPCITLEGDGTNKIFESCIKSESFDFSGNVVLQNCSKFSGAPWQITGAGTITYL